MYLVPGLAGLARTLVNVVVYRYDTPVELYKKQQYELVTAILKTFCSASTQSNPSIMTQSKWKKYLITPKKLAKN